MLFVISHFTHHLSFSFPSRCGFQPTKDAYNHKRHPSHEARRGSTLDGWVGPTELLLQRLAALITPRSSLQGVNIRLSVGMAFSARSATSLSLRLTHVDALNRYLAAMASEIIEWDQGGLVLR
jgi:hypothetical protein